MNRSGTRPRIGITVDVDDASYRSRFPYAEMVQRAGGVPLLLPCEHRSIPEYLACCDAIVTTGGDDPDLRHFGIENHPATTLIAPRRQTFELELLDALSESGHPLLAICLGMQLMGLHAGGTLEQHLPDTLATAEIHWNGTRHEVQGTLGSGEVHSHHRQALGEPGGLQVCAIAPDGVIEAVEDPAHAMRIGVQWHPERTDCRELGLGLFERLIRAASESSTTPGPRAR